MWQYLLHLWAPPPANVSLVCPPPPPGESPDPAGFFDPAPILAAYQWIAIASAAAVLLLVVLCYAWNSSSLNRRFVRKWYLFWIGTSLLGFVIPLVIFFLVPQHALAGTCETNPLPFAAYLTFAQMLPRAVAGLVWCMVAFPLASLLLTAIAGWHPASRGFFHNRGCPWPRWNPFGA